MVIKSTPLVWTIERAGKEIGLSRPSAYLAAKRGELPTIRFGKRLLVPRAALERMLSEVKPTNQT